MSYATKWGYIKENLFNIVENFKKSRNDKELKRITYNEETVIAYLNLIEDYTYYVMILTLYFTGMRIGSTLALKYSNVNFKDNIIDIKLTNTKNNIDDAKTATSIRKILIIPKIDKFNPRIKRKQYCWNLTSQNVINKCLHRLLYI